jgi:hypothetical protein
MLSGLNRRRPAVQDNAAPLDGFVPFHVALRDLADVSSAAPPYSPSVLAHIAGVLAANIRAGRIRTLGRPALKQYPTLYGLPEDGDLGDDYRPIPKDDWATFNPRDFETGLLCVHLRRLPLWVQTRVNLDDMLTAAGARPSTAAAANSQADSEAGNIRKVKLPSTRKQEAFTRANQLIAEGRTYGDIVGQIQSDFRVPRDEARIIYKTASGDGAEKRSRGRPRKAATE